MLASLSAEEYSRIEPDLETVPLTFGEIIYQFKAPIDCIYFPEREHFARGGNFHDADPTRTFGLRMLSNDAVPDARSLG